MQAQTTGRLQEFRFHRYILGALAGIGLAAAIIFGVQTLTDRDAAVVQQELAPVSVVQEDPPLPAGWVDTYFTNGAVDGYILEDPPLPEGWVDPYFSRSVSVDKASITTQADGPRDVSNHRVRDITLGSRALRIRSATVDENEITLEGHRHQPYTNEGILFTKDVIVEQQDPPLPEGWVDPYFSQTD